MSGYLFVVPPFVGHVNPTIGVADELRRRGHHVAWCGPTAVANWLPAGAVLHPCATPPPATRPANLTGFPALRFLWEQVLVPLAETMEPGVRAAVAAHRPDAMVVDQQALAGAMVAPRVGIPWATAATTSSEVSDPLAGLPKVRQWLRDLLADLRPGAADPRFSPHLVLVFSTMALAGPARATTAPVRYVGLAARPPTTRTDFPWRRLDPARPLVYIGLGTANTDAAAAFLGECVTALRARTGLQAVVADPGRSVESAPPHVLVRREVPQPELLAHASAVVCHAGHNTVCEALACGVPLVVAPIRDDQPVIAGQVVTSGAGIRLRFRHATADRIGEAVDTVLAVPGYRAAAHRIRASFRRAGGSRAAADHLEKLLC